MTCMHNTGANQDLPCQASPISPVTQQRPIRRLILISIILVPLIRQKQRRSRRRPPLIPTKQHLHIFQWTALGLRVKQEDDRYAHQVHRHKEEVNLGPKLSNTDRPQLRDNDRAHSPARSSEAQPTRASGSREDLRSVDPSCRSESHAVAE